MLFPALQTSSGPTLPHFPPQFPPHPPEGFRISFFFFPQIKPSAVCSAGLTAQHKYCLFSVTRRIPVCRQHPAPCACLVLGHAQEFGLWSLEPGTGTEPLERIKMLLSDLIDFPLEKKKKKQEAAGELGFQIKRVKLSSNRLGNQEKNAPPARNQVSTWRGGSQCQEKLSRATPAEKPWGKEVLLGPLLKGFTGGHLVITGESRRDSLEFWLEKRKEGIIS